MHVARRQSPIQPQSPLQPHSADLQLAPVWEPRGGVGPGRFRSLG